MNAPKVRVLVIDDDDLIVRAISSHLEREGYTVLTAGNGQLGVELFRQGVDAVVLDLALPDVGGDDVFRRLKMVNPSVPVIMITAHSTVTSAVAMMGEGLYHYAEKDTHLLDNITIKVKEATRGLRKPQTGSRPGGLIDLIGPSAEMGCLRMEVANLFACREPVLVIGEPGSGKRFVAEILHNASPRRSAAQIILNCAGASPDELHAELFGEDGPDLSIDNGKPGALELADGGTIILGQVSELPGMLQNKLLDYLNAGRFTRRNGSRLRTSQVRIVGTAPRSLRMEVAEKQFSNELCLALGGHRPLQIPALRDRPEDIPQLALRFLQQYRIQMGRKVRQLAPTAVSFLQTQPWPGNVRELKNLIERAVLLALDTTELSAADLIAVSDRGAPRDFMLPDDGLDLAELEKSMVRQALSRTENNRTQAGNLLGLNRDQVRYRINKFDLQDPEEDSPEGPPPLSPQ